MVCPVNQPGMVGDSVNRRNKDGILVLGDDGNHLRNIKVTPDGTVITRVDGPIDLNLGILDVQGKVRIDNTLTVNPVTVANMPDHIRVQEGLHVTQTPVEAKVAPINFEGYGDVVIPRPCRVYSIHLTVYEPTFVEIVGITGEMWIKEFKLNLFPQFIQMDKVTITTKEYAKVGGYIVYED
jgi:hypothetical protein